MDSPSALWTPLGEFQPKPILVAETTECSTTTPLSLEPQLVVLCLPTIETQNEDKVQNSDISSLIKTETINEAENFLKTNIP